MVLMPQMVSIKWGTTSRQHYIDLGYEYTKLNDTFEVEVNELTQYSEAKVKCKCDFCGEIYNIPWKRILKFKSEKYCCKSCLLHKKRVKDKNGNIAFIDIPYRNKDWLYNEYILKDKIAPDIAKECEINVRTLREWIASFDLCDKSGSKTDFIKKEELEDLYVNKKMTSEEIGKIYGLTGNTIINVMRKFDITIPNRSELMRIYYSEKGGYEKARKKYQSIEERIKASCRSQGISVENFNGFRRKIDSQIRNRSEYKEWRMNVFRRDNFTCQCCGKHGGSLNAHHIENFKTNPEKRLSIDNGITLCEECHLIKYPSSFHSLYGQSDNNRWQLDEYIKMRKMKNII